MSDPFKIDSPTCISFSGGRTSAYMLWRVLQSNGGKLPTEAVVCFANTGKEAEETLVFVRECSERWNVPIAWVEWLPSYPGFRLVDFNSASRNGEPFAALITKRKFLPNPISRFCTSELKIRAMHRYLKSLGWRDGDGCWDQMVGIRADEQRRVAKIRARPSPETVRETMCMPLADASVSVQDVGGFWEAQPFDLGLKTVNGRTLEGNCDLCFLKPPFQRLALIKKRPEFAVWWIAQEARVQSSGMATGRGARFTKDGHSYAALAAFALDQRDMFDAEQEAIPCFCGD